MGKHEKKKEKRERPPVVTGYDARAEKREGRGGAREQPSDAPDGISGKWD